MKIHPDRLWITVYLDDEAFDHWRKIGIPAERIIRLGEKDNFWGPAGDSGPCGPCSEIHYDFGYKFGCGKKDCGPACGCGRFSEIWNLVFTQYNQDKSGKRTLLPKPNIDTGMGLERLTAVMQGKHSVYQTDLFVPLLEKTADLSGKKYGQDEVTDRAIRIVAEHARGITFLINDGVVPGNEGRGYVLRRILRRASLFGRKIGLDKPFLSNLTAAIIVKMGSAYPDLVKNRDFISGVISSEEERFSQTLDTGLNWLNQIMEKAEVKREKRIRGKDVFKLYDTFGFPREISSEIAAERGFEIDLEGFKLEMEQQRERARSAHRFVTGDQPDSQIYEQSGITHTCFVGYDNDSLIHRSDVVGLVIKGKPVNVAREGDEVEIILKETPFYGEMGGQTGDKGYIHSVHGRALVDQTIRPVPEIIVHRAKVVEGQITIKDRVEAEASRPDRLDIARNHTATHLLQAALKLVLGEQVHQSGSLVTGDKLRFDFNHPASVSGEQLTRIQSLVNEKIRQNLPVAGNIMAYNEALSRGAMALFGEKYGNEVRVMEIGDPPFSLELCGGTHVKSTGEIGFFYITAESSIGSGLRRIEAVTGKEAESLVLKRLSTLEVLSKELESSPEKVQGKLSATLDELDKERKRAISLEIDLAKKEIKPQISQKVQYVNNISVLPISVSATSHETMLKMGDWIKEEIGGSAIVVAGAKFNDKLNFAVMATPDVIKKGFHSGQTVNYIAKIAGGGGGGRPELGQGSGKDLVKLEEALNQAPKLISDHLDQTSGTWVYKKGS